MATHRRPPSKSTSASTRTGARRSTGKPGSKPRSGQSSRSAPSSRSGSSSSTARRAPRNAKGNAKGGARGVAKGAPAPRKARPPRAPAPERAIKLVPRSRELVALEKLVLSSLDDMKAVNVRILDVRGLTDVADTMIVASGTSDRHVRAIAERVIEHAKAAGRRPMGTEGKQDAEWVLVDLQDVLLHVMLPRVREFYALEQLWEAPAARRPPPAVQPRPPGA